MNKLLLKLSYFDANQGKRNHVKSAVYICFVLSSSEFDAYTNYISSEVKCNNFQLVCEKT